MADRNIVTSTSPSRDVGWQDTDLCGSNNGCRVWFAGRCWHRQPRERFGRWHRPPRPPPRPPPPPPTPRESVTNCRCVRGGVAAGQVKNERLSECLNNMPLLDRYFRRRFLLWVRVLTALAHHSNQSSRSIHASAMALMSKRCHHSVRLHGGTLD